MRIYRGILSVLSLLFLVAAFPLSHAWEAEGFLPGTKEKWLVRDGDLLGEIFVAEDCDTEELLAAQKLASWIGKICGSENVGVRIETAVSDENQRGIFVGKTLASERENIRAPKKGIESYAIIPRGDSVYLVGETPVATRHAVAKFLTRNFGVEFVFPGEDGAEWTPQRFVKFPKGTFSYVPAWTWRSIGVNGEANNEWAKNLGFGVRPQFSHNLHRIFTPEVYSQYPQLAPQCFGKTLARRKGGHAPQPNLANPLAEEISLAAAKTYFSENPDATMFSLGINDCSSWDESADAGKIYGNAPFRWIRGRPNRADYFWGHVNRVAHAIAKESVLSDKKIAAIAYLDCLDAPTFPLAKNVLPVICSDRANWAFPQFEAEEKALMTRWAKSGVETWGIYDYYYGNPFFFPRIFFKAQAESLKFAYENGARLFYAEIFPQIPWDAPKIWLLAKLLENPSVVPAAELENFYALAYGKAAEPMRKFFELFEKKWSGQGGQIRWIKGWRNENSALMLGRVPEADDLLAEARGCFPKEPTDSRERRIVKRIEAAQLYWERALAFENSYRAREQLEIDSRNLKTPQSVKALLALPAWKYEEIYDDSAWLEKHEDAGFAPCQMRISDPRPTAFVRVVEALRTMPRSPERLEAEAQLAKVLAELPPEKFSRGFLSALVSVLSGTASFAENFEPIYVRNPKDGELERKTRFVALDASGWRKGKTLEVPETLKLNVAPGEHIFCGEALEAHSGEASMKISGVGNSAELYRRLPVKPGTRIAASVWACGKMAIGGTNGLVIWWKDARGRPLGEREFMRLPREHSDAWYRFVAVSAAPKNAAYADVFIGGGLGAEDDFLLVDDFEIFTF